MDEDTLRAINTLASVVDAFITLALFITCVMALMSLRRVTRERDLYKTAADLQRIIEEQQRGQKDVD